MDLCGGLKQHDFRDLIVLGDHGDNQRGMQAVAERVNRQWDRSGVRVHVIAEYYSQDLWSYDYLKTLGIHQQPDVRAAARAGIHDDYHYEAILATINPELVRTEQRLAAGLYSLNGVDMLPPGTTLVHGKKLVEYRANLTVAARRQALAKCQALQR